MDEAFTAATGDGPVQQGPGPGRASEGRAAEVRVALAGLLQIRRLTNADAPDPEAVPAAWEHGRIAQAVALGLEGSGIAPSAVDAEGRRVATGYRVRTGEPGSVVVEWLGPRGSGAGGQEEDALTVCRGVLEGLGWDALLYRGRGRHRFLEVRPPHRGG
ncbi:hypothetical protein [Streptomyces sp. NPDC059176]|uniref:hypothetical protein n=1 Tax=unclassified Streptomyces TaxID=2593676 RepID=UPI0036D1EBC9